MSAAIKLFPQRRTPPAPHNDNAPAWQGFNYMPPAPAGGLVERVFALRFWSSRIRAAAAVLVARRILR
ncbi:hypothetical protein [Caulobacter segnis]|uniref:Uncharacterized protein n=1 Tax=Caulobacter segnis TaxID=88688 RepID=A0A2W5VFI1_9CAUL|nr:hypothetical protein [Caulobacter segnis]PZR37207.1 MAG: hypothetical protein DI526_01435 [Caulobacter segnis]